MARIEVEKTHAACRCWESGIEATQGPTCSRSHLWLQASCVLFVVDRKSHFFVLRGLVMDSVEFLLL